MFVLSSNPSCANRYRLLVHDHKQDRQLVYHTNQDRSSFIIRIINKTRKILKKSIEDGGSSIQNFNDSNGKSGLFQQKFKVYGREGKKCNKISCNEYIQKIIISNRSSFYCKSCQK